MQLKPVSLDVIAEARDEAHAVVMTLMARLAPGEHVVRLGVDMEGQERPLSATLPITVEGDGSADDLVGAEPKYLENFVFLLTCGLAQTLCSGVMYLRSAAPGDDEVSTVQAWRLCWGALTECPAAEAADLLGGGEPGAYVDAFGVHCEDGDDGCEAVYPPVAYTVL
ncbi:hypothetical protein [Streptomyces sp. NPDC096032]|uniref:hypothetical protein n=1 Tax=Streptomyces sp. NPDC096032 TaxID=3366070 RepID=UPI00380E10DC